MLRITLAAFAALLLSGLAFAQVVPPKPSAEPAPDDKSFALPEGDTCTDANGNTVTNTGQGRIGVTGRGRGQLRRTGINTWELSVPFETVRMTRGGQSARVTGPMTVELDSASTSVDVNQNAAGESAVVNVDADNTVVNANGQNTTVNVGDDADGGVINANPGSSGAVTYGTSGPGTVNVHAGAGSWQIRRR